jgi:hypothetical protein
MHCFVLKEEICKGIGHKNILNCFFFQQQRQKNKTLLIRFEWFRIGQATKGTFFGSSRSEAAFTLTRFRHSVARFWVVVSVARFWAVVSVERFGAVVSVERLGESHYIGLQLKSHCQQGCQIYFWCNMPKREKIPK